MNDISVVVVDGQRTFADALSTRLAAEPGLGMVLVAESVTATRRLLVGRRVDVVLLDSELPGGLAFAAELASPAGGTPGGIKVVMLGAVPEPAQIVAALRSGVSGWVPKEDSVEQLLGVVQVVMRGELSLPAAIGGPVLRLLLEDGEAQAPSRNPLARLTPRELEVLALLAEGICRSEIAQRMHLSAHTIRSHLQNLMAKLGVHSTLEAVALARQAWQGDANLRNGTPRGERLLLIR